MSFVKWKFLMNFYYISIFIKYFLNKCYCFFICIDSFFILSYFSTFIRSIYLSVFGSLQAIDVCCELCSSADLLFCTKFHSSKKFTIFKFILFKLKLIILFEFTGKSKELIEYIQIFLFFYFIFKDVQHFFDFSCRIFIFYHIPNTLKIFTQKIILYFCFYFSFFHNFINSFYLFFISFE